MAEMKGARAGKDKAIQALMDAGETKKVGIYMPVGDHATLKSMSGILTCEGGMQGLLLEAVADLFAKYKSGKGKYKPKAGQAEFLEALLIRK